MKNELRKMLSSLAKKNGYYDEYELLMDYGFIPTVLTPKHCKIEIFKLFLSHCMSSVKRK